MPNGKLVYAHKSGEVDSCVEIAGARHSEGGNDHLAQYFRALDFLEENIDFPPDHIDNHMLVDNYMYHRCTFILLLLSLFTINIFCTLVGYLKEEKVLETVVAINDSESAPKFFVMFLKVTLTIDVVIHGCQFITGLVGYCTNKTVVLNWHSMFSVAAIFSSILL